MKLHNVDSQSRSSGVGALDNSAMSTSPVVHSDFSRIRRNLSIHIARFSASESLRAYTNIYKNSPPFASR